MNPRTKALKALQMAQKMKPTLELTPKKKPTLQLTPNKSFKGNPFGKYFI